MDNKENLLAANMLESLENYPLSRRKRGSEDSTTDVLKLQLLNKQLKDQLEAAIRKLDENGGLVDLREELVGKDRELGEVQKQLQDSQFLNQQLQEDIAATRKLLQDARTELASKASAWTAREREYQILLTRSKDQNSRITELETYKLKYESMRDKQNRMESHRQGEQDQKQLKLTSAELEAQYKQLKVVLADCQFELKKSTEDGATYRTLNEMEKVKTSKEHESKIAALKKHADEENQNWVKRFQLRDEQFRKEVESVKSKYGMDRQSFEATIRAEMAQFKRKLQSERDGKLATMKKEAEDQRRSLLSQKESSLASQKSSYEKQLEDMKCSYEKTLQKKKKEYQINICSAISERKTEETLHQNTRKELAALKEKLYDEIYTLRKEVSRLEEQLKESRQVIIDRQTTISQLGQRAEETRISHLQQIEQIGKEHRRQMAEAQESMKTQLAKILEEQLDRTQGLSVQLRSIQSTQQQQQQFYQKQVDQLSTYFEQRPSRQQDLRTIQQLQQKLLKRQGDIQLLSKELKWHRLELENKEQTYNRIFSNGINEVRIPTEHMQNGVVLPHRDKLHQQQVRDFKFRKMTKSLLQQKEPKSMGMPARKEA